MSDTKKDIPKIFNKDIWEIISNPIDVYSNMFNNMMNNIKEKDVYNISFQRGGNIIEGMFIWT